jgi:short-subunit dehydrogenase
LNIDGLPDLVSRALALEGSLTAWSKARGISQRAEASETAIAVYKKLMDLNYFAPVAITQAILPHFKKHNKGIWP